MLISFLTQYSKKTTSICSTWSTCNWTSPKCWAFSTRFSRNDEEITTFTPFSLPRYPTSRSSFSSIFLLVLARALHESYPHPSYPQHTHYTLYSFLSLFLILLLLMLNFTVRITQVSFVVCVHLFRFLYLSSSHVCLSLPSFTFPHLCWLLWQGVTLDDYPHLHVFTFDSQLWHTSRGFCESPNPL